ncbi:endonuclease III, partial [Candidatus Peregrinibacteria bacterium]|nr:endonuclease III [Candidatus Peregrinibacteria bacterium]
RTKAKNIQAMCQLLVTRFRGKVPETMEELTQLPGVGRKTAAIILAAAFGKNEGIACDTHVIRLSQRLGLTRHHDPKSIELDLMRLLPRCQWRVINPLLISHGRAICTARNRKCGQCVFQKECPSSLTMGRKDLAKK